MKKIKKSTIVLIALAVVTVVLNIVAWCSVTFCDFYVENIFPIWINTYSRVMSVFPFSVGEILIILGILVAVVRVVSFIFIMAM